MNDFSLPQFEQILNFFLFFLFLSFDFCFLLCCCCWCWWWWWWLCRLSSFDLDLSYSWICLAMSRSFFYFTTAEVFAFSFPLPPLSPSLFTWRQSIFLHHKIAFFKRRQSVRWEGREPAMKTQKFALYSFPSLLSAFKTSVGLSVRLSDRLVNFEQPRCRLFLCFLISLFINQLSNLATTNGTRCASQQGRRTWRETSHHSRGHLALICGRRC